MKSQMNPRSNFTPSGRTAMAACSVFALMACVAAPAAADGMLEEIMPMHEQTAYQPGVTVPIDNSAMLPLNGNAATVVVGNPSIAEVTVQNGNLLFILGRNFGTTNVIALDNQNNEIANIPISVTANVPHHMTLYRGAAQVSYSCASRCERSLTPGDVGDEYDTAQTQVKAKLSIGKGASGQQ